MNILQLTSYPTGKPQHGGQIRSSNIAAALRDAGHKVKCVAVFVDRYYGADSADDIPFGLESSLWREDQQNLSDYLSGLFAVQDSEAFARLDKVADEFAPDVIISEQPWMMGAARKLASTRPGVSCVYSSQNVEFRLKEAVLKAERLPDEQVRKLVDAIRDLEFDAVAEADLVIACTEADAAFYRQALPDSRPAIVAGNGVERFSCSAGRVEQWRNYIGQSYPIFVSSAHPPNAQGFWDMLAPGLTFLRPEEPMLIAGGVSDILLNMPGIKPFEMVNRSRIRLLGRMEQRELQAVISASHVVLLPITQGEGSNLKTAEALESGCPIVGTSKAFRGFEQAVSLPHVRIADDPDSFRSAVRSVLDSPRYDGGTDFELRSQFHWPHLLAKAVEAIGQLKP
ncbi:glycosyl transferase [Sphingobium lactosutens]|uniref:glycosyltransferase n=1 Tax=Sphingobium lactosutens TaxID=522773 RepID=UPI0015C1BC76|nr:glycosyltransferase [Sphingobium lactosutens]NWK97381.1 glycosyl transferase [Sphingobium lactosutens]